MVRVNKIKTYSIHTVVYLALSKIVLICVNTYLLLCTATYKMCACLYMHMWCTLVDYIHETDWLLYYTRVGALVNEC